jgi:hypothetical protein
MGSLQEDIFKRISDDYARAIYGKNTHTRSIYQMIMDGKDKPDYYARRKHGKWAIHDKDGMRIAGRLNEREMKNYMKLLTGE